MRRLLLVVVLLIMLPGCKQSNNSNLGSPSIDEITTYEEVIKDGKVEIDGILYDIQSVSKATNSYDDNDNIIETRNDNSEARSEYIYENNKLIEDRKYSNNELSTTTYYYYENDLLIKRKTVTRGGLEAVTEHSYGDKTETQTHYKSDGSISFSSKAYLDNKGKIIKGIITDEDGEIMDTRTFHYDNDLLNKTVVEKDGTIVQIFNFEYNNVGDKIMDYIIIYDKDNVLIARFYDIEYNEKLLPKTVTLYTVQSKIAEEDIRNYQ